jgi:uncharacterized protein YidB (DUF937 family)
MGVLDEILGGLGGQAAPGPGGQGGLGGIADLIARNPQIIAAALSLLNHRDGSVGGNAGLGDLVGSLQQKGLGDVISSWVSTGPNRSITPGQLSSVLGDETLGQFARKAGIGTSEAGGVLASLLPVLVDRLTPQGRVPESADLEGALGSLLSGLGR